MKKLLLYSLTIFISLGIAAQILNNKQSDKIVQQTPENSGQLTDSLEKYVGEYVFLNKYRCTFQRFPVNSRVQSKNAFLPLDKQFIGKYFFVNDFVQYIDTTKITSYAGGYLAPPTGNIVLGVDAAGNIQTQNYDNYGKHEGTMKFNLGGTGTYGQFVKRDDGKYDLLINNGRYVRTK